MSLLRCLRFHLNGSSSVSPAQNEHKSVAESEEQNIANKPTELYCIHNTSPKTITLKVDTFFLHKSVRSSAIEHFNKRRLKSVIKYAAHRWSPGSWATNCQAKWLTVNGCRLSDGDSHCSAISVVWMAPPGERFVILCWRLRFFCSCGFASQTAGRHSGWLASVSGLSCR